MPKDQSGCFGAEAEVLVKVAASSVNPSDTKNVLGRMEGTTLPRIPGRDFASPSPPVGEVGTGSVHHIAMAVEDEKDQLMIMRKLNASGVGNSGIIDRFWFKSLYFRDPDWNLLEIATKGPGYTADEPLDQMGSRLVLAPWLESRRGEIEGALNELDMKNAHSWPPTYPRVPSRPESLPN